MWKRRGVNWTKGVRRIASAVRRYAEDEGDWSYASEWWGDRGADGGSTVFRATSDHGNGVVCVVSYPCSQPSSDQFPVTERWIRERYAKIHPEEKDDEKFRVLGYQWRVLRFNDYTRQTTVKVMAAFKKSEPGFMYLMQQPNCLPVPYLKSMVSAGLCSLASTSYNLVEAVAGRRDLNVLCIGHGGGSLPLFLASKIRGAMVDSIEIDPVVITASTEAMGFPSSTLVKNNAVQIPSSQPIDSSPLFYPDIQNRLILHNADAGNFILNTSNIYDLVFIDAYDGDDIFPRKMWDQDGIFLKTLNKILHPIHGTAVVNLHSDADVLVDSVRSGSSCEYILPMGKYVSQVCSAYKRNIGFAFKVSVPWLCNVTLVAKKGIVADRNLFANSVFMNADLVERLLELPFPCLEYIRRGFVIVDK